MLDRLIALIAANENALGLLLIGLFAGLEYVFPPVPGDAVVVFGAFLVVRRGWSPVSVFTVVLLGSAAGSMLDFYLGRAFAARRKAPHPRLDALVERFRRHGALYLVVNRFLPSVRALFFVAAGMAGLPAWKVLVFGLASAALWNALLFALGATVGTTWPALREAFATYGAVAWTVLGAIALGFALRWLFRRRRKA